MVAKHPGLSWAGSAWAGDSNTLSTLEKGRPSFGVSVFLLRRSLGWTRRVLNGDSPPQSHPTALQTSEGHNSWLWGEPLHGTKTDPLCGSTSLERGLKCASRSFSDSLPSLARFTLNISRGALTIARRQGLHLLMASCI